MEVLIGFLIGIIVAAVGAWCAVYFQRYFLKQQNTLNLSEKYNSPEFHVIRSVAWDVKKNWSKQDHRIVKYFIDWVDQDSIQERYEKSSNGLWPHQNLSTLLHFFGNLARYYDAGLVDKKLVQVLFGPQYFWYKEFIHEFIKEYESQMEKHKIPAPQWVTALLRLEEILDDRKDA